MKMLIGFDRGSGGGGGEKRFLELWPLINICFHLEIVLLFIEACVVWLSNQRVYFSLSLSLGSFFVKAFRIGVVSWELTNERKNSLEQCLLENRIMMRFLRIFPDRIVCGCCVYLEMFRLIYIFFSSSS